MNKKGLLWFLFSVLVSFAVQAAKPLVMAVGINKPPYIFQQNNTGFEVELLEKVFQIMDTPLDFSYINYGRGGKILELPELDALASVNDSFTFESAFLSDEYIEYHNVAISLRENALKINSVADLANHSVVSFPLAEKALGVEFTQAISASPMYTEMLEHDKQPEMLMRKRVDILVMDHFIFNYYLKQSEWATSGDKVMVHHIFPVNRFRIAFKKEAYVAPFNLALKTFIASSEYQALKYKYGLDADD